MKSFLRHLAIVPCLLAGCDRSEQDVESIEQPGTKADAPVVEPVAPDAIPEAAPSTPIVAAARSQIGQTTIYDGAYVGLAYPGGDVPIQRGVCTDVVIRALRDAHNMDLQQLVHEDMTQSFSKGNDRHHLSRLIIGGPGSRFLIVEVGSPVF